MFDPTKHTKENDVGYQLCLRYNKMLNTFNITGYTMTIPDEGAHVIHVDQDGKTLTFRTFAEVIDHLVNYEER